MGKAGGSNGSGWVVPGDCGRWGGGGEVGTTPTRGPQVWIVGMSHLMVEAKGGVMARLDVVCQQHPQVHHGVGRHSLRTNQTQEA
eukprot:728871-Pyramimonas_sp.AAC.1